MRQTGKLLGALVALYLVTGNVFAQAWPVKPVRVIVPLPPGSGTDITGRAIAASLAAQTGQPFLVENRPGGAGTIGMNAVAKADPDGYTILVMSSSWTVSPITVPNLPFDVLKDLAGVTVLADIANALAVRADRNFKSVKDLVAAAKANPGKMNAAVIGLGSATHLTTERFRLSAGIDVTSVPYKGTPESLTDVLSGRVDYCFCPIGNVLPMVKDGRLLALAVSSPRRTSGLPDIPTTEEAGVPNSAQPFWVGMGVPARTPRELVAKLHAETVKALNSPETKARWASLSQDARISTPEQFDAFLRDDMARNAALIKDANLKFN
ncbi:MAG: tripartite tricarboxylate transporter substrate binding protein [Betaproteobacteria bacterium]|nr:tripartite tricarboxylate transporter substrate binding protein [Betaproteobacteria bacterium]